LDQLQAAGIPVSGSVIRGADGDNHYFVFIDVQRDARGRQIPTRAKLEAAKELLREKGDLIDFLLRDAATHDIEAGLRATLLHSFGELLRNSFVSSWAKDAFVWVVPKKQLTDPEFDEIERKARIFLENVGLRLAQIARTWGENLPSKTKCVAMLRQVSPVSSAELARFLREADFVVPSDDWMTRRLDALRKAGLVVRMKSGRYALTLRALKSLGTVKGPLSPDLSRLLALAGKRG
jgi:hypothetical protein